MFREAFFFFFFKFSYTRSRARLDSLRSADRHVLLPGPASLERRRLPVPQFPAPWLLAPRVVLPEGGVPRWRPLKRAPQAGLPVHSGHGL